MTALPPTTLADAEASQLKALLAPTSAPVRSSLHRQVIAIHSAAVIAPGNERFLAHAANRRDRRPVGGVA